MNAVLEHLIERVAKLPASARDEIVRSVLEIERRHSGIYALNAEERADILEALDEIARNDVASADEAAAVFDRLVK